MNDERLDSKKKIIDYFSSRESRWGYTFLLKGIKHFGYYPKGREKIHMEEAQKLMIEKIYEKLKPEAGSLLLDAGCGEGETALYLADKYNLQIKGIDLTDLSISQANKNLASRKLEKQVKFETMDYENLDFPDQTFDIVYTMETLVHSTDYSKALSEFYRVLKPRGKIILFEYSMAPFNDFPKNSKKEMEIVYEESGMHSLPYFIHGRFPEILKNAGFSDVAVEDATEQIMPMLKKFYNLAYLPYKFIKSLNLERRYVNTTAGVKLYGFAKNGLWKYNIITAIK